MRFFISLAIAAALAAGGYWLFYHGKEVKNFLGQGSQQNEILVFAKHVPVEQLLQKQSGETLGEIETHYLPHLVLHLEAGDKKGILVWDLTDGNAIVDVKPWTISETPPLPFTEHSDLLAIQKYVHTTKKTPKVTPEAIFNKMQTLFGKNVQIHTHHIAYLPVVQIEFIGDNDIIRQTRWNTITGEKYAY